VPFVEEAEDGGVVAVGEDGQLVLVDWDEFAGVHGLDGVVVVRHCRDRLEDRDPHRYHVEGGVYVRTSVLSVSRRDGADDEEREDGAQWI